MSTHRGMAREIKRLERVNQKLADQEGLILHAIKEAYKETHNLSIPDKPDVSSGDHEEIAVLHLSDLHFGKKTETYDHTMGAKRLTQIGDKLIKNVECRRHVAAINELRLYLGGDMVEGEIIFSHQPHLITLNTFDQAVRFGPRVMAEFIIRMLSCFQKVVVCTVPGNHGRSVPKNAGGHPMTNWDRVFYAVTKLVIEREMGVSNLRGRLDWVDAETFYVIDYVFDWGNLLIHGDQISGGKFGYPWYGVGRKANGWLTSIDQDWNYLYHGHFHTLAQHTVNSQQFLANGTTESSNEYALEEMAASGTAVQRACIYDADHGMIQDHWLYLEPRTPRGVRTTKKARWTPKKKTSSKKDQDINDLPGQPFLF